MSRSLLGFRYWPDPHPLFEDSSAEEHDRLVNETLDRQKFQKWVTFSTAIGFFADTYNLFAINTVMPMLGYVYWDGKTPQSYQVSLSISALAGSIVGQLLFGFLADVYGRRRMYGRELMVTVGALFGVVMSSTGEFGSMNVLAWFVTWRFVLGIGIGADYPLSSVMCSEFAPSAQRGRMIATVFFMQPVGQLVATLVAIAAVYGARDSIPHDKGIEGCDEVCIRAIDRTWRLIIGCGAIPAAVALLFRLTVPESPRWTSAVALNSRQALDDTCSFLETQQADPGEEIQPNGAVHHPEVPPLPRGPVSLPEIIRYFRHRGPGMALAGTALSWLLLDLPFYGLGFNSPRVISKLWHAQPGPDEQFLYRILLTNGTHSLVVVSIGGLTGGLLMIAFGNHINRRKLQIWGFCILGALFIVIGSSFHRLMGSDHHGALVPLYVMTQVFFNFGPNSTTFIIPAEYFPTRYRSTAHGFSAAAGKLGSVIAQILLTYIRFHGQSVADPESKSLGYVLLVFSGFMFLGSLITLKIVPDTQEPSGAGIRLEKWEVGVAGPPPLQDGGEDGHAQQQQRQQEQQEQEQQQHDEPPPPLPPPAQDPYDYSYDTGPNLGYAAPQMTQVGTATTHPVP